MKTAEEILTNYRIEFGSVTRSNAIKAMEAYASQYREEAERLRAENELMKSHFSGIVQIYIDPTLTEEQSAYKMYQIAIKNR
jgi:hypothetical protein